MAATAGQAVDAHHVAVGQRVGLEGQEGLSRWAAPHNVLSLQGSCRVQCPGHAETEDLYAQVVEDRCQAHPPAH